MQTPTYLITPELRSAVDVAIQLNIPLLVTGEPGTGKTQLATYVAQEMLQTQLLRFNTKTTSKARDLLYHYHALTHFRDSQQGKDDIHTMKYVQFRALGKAIVESSHTRYVVLIDEIDKAPRDFPNDVLFEFEELKFRVDEASEEELASWKDSLEHEVSIDAEGVISFAPGSNHQPVLIITSNSEKNLPDAFLRRCAYYHIPFPKRQQLIDIVQANVPLSPDFGQAMLEAAIEHFLKIREQNLSKRPATAELLAWVHVLQARGIDVRQALNGSSDSIRQQLCDTYVLLAKNKEDRDLLLNQ